MKKILLADDDENIRLLLRTALDEPDYVLFEAGDGALAHLVKPFSPLDLLQAVEKILG